MFSILFLRDPFINCFKWKLTFGKFYSRVDAPFSHWFFTLAYRRNRCLLCTSLLLSDHSSPHIWYSCYQTLLHIISTYWSYRVEISIPNSLRALTQKIDFGTQVEVVIIYFRKASNCLFIKSTKTHIVFRIWCSFSNYWHVFWIFMDIFWGVLKLYFFTKEVIILIC